MRFSIIATSAIAAFATTGSAAHCRRLQPGAIKSYSVTADGAHDAGAICGALWDNLKQFAGCAAPSETSCSGSFGGHLTWSFDASASCDGGMVEATWWDATKNEFGAIDCP